VAPAAGRGPGGGTVVQDVAAAFARAGCEGTLCARSLETGAEVAFRADEPVVPASVVKVQIALEAETRFADGRLDPRERVTMGAAERTPGPVGLSFFDDDAVVSWRDLVMLMLTLSDNPATDALLRRIGVDAVNAAAVRLGLAATVIDSDLRTMLDAIGRDIAGGGWQESLAWAAGASAQELAAADERLLATRALDPARGTRTTARDMTLLLELIWTDRAGPPAACARVRTMMARQLTRHRIANGFRSPVRVAAKSGGLAGVVRNEIGVVHHPDGSRYAVAVFTRSRPGSDDAAINRAVGTVAAAAVAALRGESG